jgi:hypothetical protein
MLVRTQVYSSIWSVNHTLIRKSIQEANVYKSKMHQLWMFNQLARRIHEIASKQTTREYVYRVLTEKPNFKPLTIQFF